MDGHEAKPCGAMKASEEFAGSDGLLLRPYRAAPGQFGHAESFAQGVSRIAAEEQSSSGSNGRSDRMDLLIQTHRRTASHEAATDELTRNQALNRPCPFLALFVQREATSRCKRKQTEQPGRH